MFLKGSRNDKLRAFDLLLVVLFDPCHIAIGFLAEFEVYQRFVLISKYPSEDDSMTNCVGGLSRIVVIFGLRYKN